MFGTWKYDPETDEVQNLRSAFDPVTARSSNHQACDRCHEKKLKCSGEKDGCERCIANTLLCEYTRTGSKGPRRGKKTRSSLSAPTRGSSSATSSASPNPTECPSPVRGRRSSSRQMRQSTTIGSRSPVLTSKAPVEGISGILDFSSISLEGGIDSNLLHGASMLPQTTLVSASPTNYATAHEYASTLAFGGQRAHTYPQWPVASTYDHNLATTADLLAPYPATTAADTRSFMSQDLPHANDYMGYQEPSYFGSYPDSHDYSNIDPRFWPPTTQPGP